MEQEEAGEATRNIMSLDVIAGSAEVTNFDFFDRNKNKSCR